jgi:hypothetical protein
LELPATSLIAAFVPAIRSLLPKAASAIRPAARLADRAAGSLVHCSVMGTRQKGRPRRSYQLRQGDGNTRTGLVRAVFAPPAPFPFCGTRTFPPPRSGGGGPREAWWRGPHRAQESSIDLRHRSFDSTFRGSPLYRPAGGPPPPLRCDSRTTKSLKRSGRATERRTRLRRRRPARMRRSARAHRAAAAGLQGPAE